MVSTVEILDQLEQLLHSAGGSEQIFVEVRDNGVETVIGANTAGLIYLATQLVSLSQKAAAGSHIHIDCASVADVSERPLVIRRSARPRPN